MSFTDIVTVPFSFLLNVAGTATAPLLGIAAPVLGVAALYAFAKRNELPPLNPYLYRDSRGCDAKITKFVTKGTDFLGIESVFATHTQSLTSKISSDEQKIAQEEAEKLAQFDRKLREGKLSVASEYDLLAHIDLIKREFDKRYHIQDNIKHRTETYEQLETKLREQLNLAQLLTIQSNPKNSVTGGSIIKDYSPNIGLTRSTLTCHGNGYLITDGAFSGKGRMQNLETAIAMTTANQMDKTGKPTGTITINLGDTRRDNREAAKRAYVCARVHGYDREKIHIQGANTAFNPKELEKEVARLRKKLDADIAKITGARPAPGIKPSDVLDIRSKQPETKQLEHRLEVTLPSAPVDPSNDPDNIIEISADADADANADNTGVSGRPHS